MVWTMPPAEWPIRCRRMAGSAPDLIARNCSNSWIAPDARGRERIRVLLHLAPQLPAQRPRQALEPLVLPVVEALLEALPARSASELGLAAGHVLEHVGDGLARAGFPHQEYREDAVGVQQRDPDARGLRRGLLVGEAAVRVPRAVDAVSGAQLPQLAGCGKVEIGRAHV